MTASRKKSTGEKKRRGKKGRKGWRRYFLTILESSTSCWPACIPGGEGKKKEERGK